MVFDPATTNFYATSSQGNLITAFDPDNSATSSIEVGINPTSLAYNFQTSTILTVNALSNTISMVDSQTFRTRITLGVGGSSQFAAAIHSLTNLAVITDQSNNRVYIVAAAISPAFEIARVFMIAAAKRSAILQGLNGI